MFEANACLQGYYQNFSSQELFDEICNNYIVDESLYLEKLMQLAESDAAPENTITAKTLELIEAVRASDKAKEGVEAFLQEYSLDTEEGIVLMCLAEALLRIPDPEVANKLIKNKLGAADWAKHLGQSQSKFVNASTWGLMLTGKVIEKDSTPTQATSTINRLINKLSEPVLRTALNQAMKLMGRQFVLGRNIKEALARGSNAQSKGYGHSFDMLGEAAQTQEDAQKFFNEYKNAITAIGAKQTDNTRIKPSISIKLSALHPRYESTQRTRVLEELYFTLVTLLTHAREQQVAVTIDAEEADRLEISLELFAKLLDHDCCQGWNDFGLVVQAYSKRALPILQWLEKLARDKNKRLPIRLVKGAYWDSEIKWAQQMGLDGYPVFTRKIATDVSYLACAKFMLHHVDRFYPQFATHNAQTVMSILAHNQDFSRFEFQRLHGMGEILYDTVMKQHPELRCRIYAPVGEHKDLLPYLVRRLLENGANTSFVHRLVDEKTPAIELAAPPLAMLKASKTKHNDKIPLPTHMYGPDRSNASGTNLHAKANYSPLMDSYQNALASQWHGHALIHDISTKHTAQTQGEASTITCPFDAKLLVGTFVDAQSGQIPLAIDHAKRGFQLWSNTSVEQRCEVILKIAEKFEQHKAELMALCTLEGGKTIQEGIDEVREAVDFCHYYVQQARDLHNPLTLPGPTGESNELMIEGRGVFLCISPWNFPLAIFTGQIVAALAVGNAVIAKPAEQTRLIAFRAVQLMLEAGVPSQVLQLLPGPGSTIGATLTNHPGIDGVAFTGSTTTAQRINRALAERENTAIAPLIAETGGQNAMIVDSSALPEQVINDVIQSGFTSAGQRCSALRVLYLQRDIASRVISGLKGAMNELNVGDPRELNCDIGPVIDKQAKTDLENHIESLKQKDQLIHQYTLPHTASERGQFVPPTVLKIDTIGDLMKENFGPIVHVVEYSSKELDKVIDSINNCGFGLTLGIHTRNEATAQYIAERARVGNVYINRNMIGATVGVQPFGGQGLSGTGPKAGGPHYLLRFATEKTITNNTAAIGGNATLLSLEDD